MSYVCAAENNEPADLPTEPKDPRDDAAGGVEAAVGGFSQSRRSYDQPRTWCGGHEEFVGCGWEGQCLHVENRHDRGIVGQALGA